MMFVFEGGKTGKGKQKSLFKGCSVYFNTAVEKNKQQEVCSRPCFFLLFFLSRREVDSPLLDL